MSIEFDITDKADLEMARWDIRRHVRFALGVTSRAALDLAAEFPRGSRAADVNARLILIDRLICMTGSCLSLCKRRKRCRWATRSPSPRILAP